MVERTICDLGESARDDEAMKAFRVVGGVHGWSPNSHTIPHEVR